MTGGLTDRNDTPFGTWQLRFIDWFRDLGFLQKPGVETKAAKDIVTFLSQEKFPEAIKEYNKVLERNPNFPGVHEALGELYHRKVDYAIAEKEFRLALLEDPMLMLVDVA